MGISSFASNINIPLKIPFQNYFLGILYILKFQLTGTCSCPRLNNCCGAWEGWNPVNWFNHTSWVAIVTPTDRPKSVRNPCVIEVFGGVLCCHVAFWILMAFVIGLSRISSFFLKNSKELLEHLKSPNFNHITSIKSFNFSNIYSRFILVDNIFVVFAGKIF